MERLPLIPFVAKPMRMARAMSIFPSTDRLTPGFWKGSGYVSVTAVPGGGTVSDSFELRKLQAQRLIGVRVARGETVLADEPFIVPS